MSRMARNPTLIKFALAALVAVPFGLSAQDRNGSYAGTEFEIEVIVLKRNPGYRISQETWPQKPQLRYERNWIDFETPDPNPPAIERAEPLSIGANDASLENTEEQLDLLPAVTVDREQGSLEAQEDTPNQAMIPPLLKPVDGTLQNVVAALTRDPNYQVLFHKAWRQVLQEHDEAPQILIKGGDALEGNQYQLGGGITVSVSRYLNLTTNLWYTDELSTQQASATPGNPPIQVPISPRAIQNAEMARAALAEQLESGLVVNTVQEVGSTVMADWPPSIPEPVTEEETTNPLLATRVALLQEKRRMRSKELHYIDHPLLNVLIEVRPIETETEAGADQ
ncbi:CsiV family protein [Biformimicrobium ophioploci]|nr:CsiV family protein [Microbulbifer sp. NKW57]